MPDSASFAPVTALVPLLAALPAPWWVAGGWAIDLWLGAVTRPHQDLEIGIWRSDQAALRSHLAGWDLLKAVRGAAGGEWVPWPAGDPLVLPVHQVLARRGGEEPAEIEFFLNDADEAGRWRFRRDDGIRHARNNLVLPSGPGLPIVAPEVVLLHKATHRRPKDEHDLRVARPRLDAAQRAWLRTALATLDPAHPWLAQL
jgi:hypothetical protein